MPNWFLLLLWQMTKIILDLLESFFHVKYLFEHKLLSLHKYLWHQELGCCIRLEYYVTDRFFFILCVGNIILLHNKNFV